MCHDNLMVAPSLATSLDSTQFAAMSDEELSRLGLSSDEVSLLRSMPPTRLSSMIPVVLATGKKKAEHIQELLSFAPEIDTDGSRRCVYVDAHGCRCDSYGDKNTPVCRKHAHKAQSLGSYFQSPSLRQTYDSFMSSPDKMKADGELALMRTMLATLLGKLNDDNINIEIIAGVTTMCEKITQAVDRITKLERITPEHLQNLMKKMVDIAAEFVPPDKLSEFATKIEAINLNNSDVQLRSDIRYLPGEVINGAKIVAVDQDVLMQKAAMLDVAERMGIQSGV